MTSVAEKLAEARVLAALLSAYGRPELRERVLEILATEGLGDTDKLGLLRYELGVLLDSDEIPPHQRLRVESWLREQDAER